MKCHLRIHFHKIILCNLSRKRLNTCCLYFLLLFRFLNTYGDQIIHSPYRLNVFSLSHLSHTKHLLRLMRYLFVSWPDFTLQIHIIEGSCTLGCHILCDELFSLIIGKADITTSIEPYSVILLYNIQQVRVRLAISYENCKL